MSDNFDHIGPYEWDDCDACEGYGSQDYLPDSPHDPSGEVEP